MAPVSPIPVFLPKSRETVGIILEAYFTRLNFHRPVVLRHEFERTLNQLYDGQLVPDDPGFVCSAYLVFALGTLSELNHRVSQHENNVQPSTSIGPDLKALMPPDWPDHDEFFQFALKVKPDLRVTVSSLQALILLHWYLYTEVSAYRGAINHSANVADLLTATGTYSLASGRQPGPACYRTGLAPRPYVSG